MRFEVYMHTSPSGKSYVGWTSRGWRKRWQNHVADAKRGRGGPLYNALRCYGPDAFAHEILVVVGTEDEAKSEERRLIAERGTLEPLGYNATCGGEGSTLVYGDAARARMSAKLVGNTRGRANRGRQHSAEFAKRVGDRMRGTAASEATREKMRAAWTPERRAARAAQAAKFWTPERRAQQAERMRARHDRG